jgi:hypothetical protein
VNCDPHKIQEFFDRLKQDVERLPSAFIFNLNEPGFQDWADRKKRTVIVPATYQESEIACSIYGATKRSSLLVCIAADGTHLKPLLILPRKTIEPEVLEQGITESMCKMVYQDMALFRLLYLNNSAGMCFFRRSGIDAKSLEMPVMLF